MRRTTLDKAIDGFINAAKIEGDRRILITSILIVSVITLLLALLQKEHEP